MYNPTQSINNNYRNQTKLYDHSITKPLSSYNESTPIHKPSSMIPNFIVVLFCIFSIGIILLIYHFTSIKSNYIHHSECITPVGDYSVIHGKTARYKKVTGENITSLSEAITYCNNDDDCQMFEYDETQVDDKRMHIITNISTPFTRSKKINIYIKNYIVNKQNKPNQPSSVTTSSYQVTTSG